MTRGMVEVVQAEVLRAGDRTLILRLRDRGGRDGWGDCSPLPGRSPDTTEGCARALERALAGRPPLPALAPTSTAAAGAIDVLDRSLPAARFALETALLDLAAQVTGRSVAELLADEPIARLACSAVVPPTGPGPDVPPGIATWKVKIGDLARLEQDLADIGRAPPHVRVRLDVNGRWSRAEAAHHLPHLAALGPEWVEEPTSAADIIALAALGALPALAPLGPVGALGSVGPLGAIGALPTVRALPAVGAPPPVTLALDESVVDDPAATIEALERGLVRVLVHKPAILGGLAAVAGWAARARRAGAVPVVSHLFDGPIALAASAELALALARSGDPAAGLGPHHGLAVLPGARIPQLAGGGTHIESHRPGLGVAP